MLEASDEMVKHQNWTRNIDSFDWSFRIWPNSTGSLAGRVLREDHESIYIYTYTVCMSMSIRCFCIYIKPFFFGGGGGMYMHGTG